MSSFLSRENRAYRATAECKFEWLCSEAWLAVEGKKDGIICGKIPTIGVQEQFLTAFSHGFTVFSKPVLIPAARSMDLVFQIN
jgi:hypothetical protein